MVSYNPGFIPNTKPIPSFWISVHVLLALRSHENEKNGQDDLLY